MRMGYKEIKKIKSFENIIMNYMQEIDITFNKLDYKKNLCRRTNIFTDGITDNKRGSFSESDKKF